MAKFRYQHIKSSVEGKAPTAAQLKVAEIGVNDFAGDEKLFIKNSEGEVVDFPRGYSRADIDAADRVVAESLNDLNSRKLDASAYTPTDLSDYYTKEEIDEFNETTSASLNDLEERKADKSDLDDLDEQFETISAALNDLENRKADKSDYYTKSDIDDTERTIAESLNDLNSRKADKSDVEALDEQFEVISASLNDLEERKADKDDIESLDEQFEVIAASLNDLENRKANEVDLEEIGETTAYALNDLECNKADKDEFDDQFETIAASLNDLEERKANKSDVEGLDDQFEVISAALNDLEERKADKSDLDDLDEQFETISASLNDLEHRKAEKEEVSAITEDLEVVAAALNDLESKKLDVSAYTPVDLTNYYTKSETSAATEISSAISGFADSVQYNSTTHYVEFYHGTTAGTKVFEYDASPFLIDGMVESVVITSITSGASTVQVLEITWNSAAGSQVTDIPLSDIFDPSLYYTKSETSGATELSTEFAKYYTKSEVDEQLGSGFSQSSVTEVIESNELITSTVLNELNDVKADKEEDLDGLKLKKITQSDYDDLVNAGEIDPNTLYIIID